VSPIVSTLRLMRPPLSRVSVIAYTAAPATVSLRWRTRPSESHSCWLESTPLPIALTLPSGPSRVNVNGPRPVTRPSSSCVMSSTLRVIPPIASERWSLRRNPETSA
jgi:hypothetical protein